MRSYREGDEHDIIKLWKLVTDERTSEYWNWEHKNNPLGNLIGVAESNGKIIGTMAFNPALMKIGDKITCGSQAIELMVHPEFRRQGIFLILGKFLSNEAKRKGIEITYAFPTPPVRIGHSKYGWFDVCRVPVLTKFMNTNKLVSYLNKYRVLRFLNNYKTSTKILRCLLSVFLIVDIFFQKVYYQTEREKSKLENVEVHNTSCFDKRINDLWKRILKKYGIVVVRDQRYLDWRFFDRPNSNYEVFVAEKDGAILGYMVLLTRNEDNMKSGYIVDILVEPDKTKMIPSLISKAIEHFKEKNVDSITCWMLKSHSIYKILKENGFINVISVALMSRINTRTRTSQICKDYLKDQTNWYITMSDSDWI